MDGREVAKIIAVTLAGVLALVMITPLVGLGLDTYFRWVGSLFH